MLVPCRSQARIKEEGWAWGQLPHPVKKEPATETNTREPRTSVLCRREGGPAGPRMTRSGESPREATTPKLLETRTTINIATWNVRTMLETSRAAQIATEMKKNNITVPGLCETRWPDSGQLTLTSGEKILYSGQEGEDDRHTGGVGIMLAKRAQEALIEWNPISPRIILVRFRSKTRNVTFINCYAPTNSLFWIVKVRVYRFFVFFVLRHWWVWQVFTPRMSRKWHILFSVELCRRWQVPTRSFNT